MLCILMSAYYIIKSCQSTITALLLMPHDPTLRLTPFTESFGQLNTQSPTCNEILVLGLNPAFQATLHFDWFRPGKVNRAVRKANSIGGKGIYQ